MSDVVAAIEGRTSKIKLTTVQRFVIETLHGLIEIRAEIDKSRGKHVELVVTMPEELRARKGPLDELQLHAKYLALEDPARPAYHLWSAALVDDVIEVKRATTLVVQAP